MRINITDSITAPVLRVFDGSVSVFKRMIPFAAAREEARLLRERVALLTREAEEAKSLEAENARLKALLDFKESVPYSTIAARVIGRDPSNWSSSVIIDKGYRDGIRPNKAVLSSRGLVGRVIEVGSRSSRIILINDPNSKAGVAIARNRQGGMLVGQPGGGCRIVYLALDSDVAAGDKIMTAGFGSIFPKDILVGEVKGIHKEPGRLYKNAVIKTAQDLSKLEEVLCIR